MACCPAAAAAVVDFLTTCPDPDRALGRAGGRVRRQLALDLCAVGLGSGGAPRGTEAWHLNDGVVDTTRGTDTTLTEKDAGGWHGLRDALMVDYAPSLTAAAAARLLVRLREACGAAVDGVEVFTVDDVVLVAHAERLLRRLMGGGGGGDESPTRAPPPRFVDVSGGESSGDDDGRVCSASERRRVTETSARRCMARAAATLMRQRQERLALGALGEGGQDGGDGLATYDITAALGPEGLAHVPLPTVTGWCLGYPWVYTWDPPGNIERAAATLSSMSLRLVTVTVSFSVGQNYSPTRGGKMGGVGSRGEIHTLCSFTTPSTLPRGEDADGTGKVEGDGSSEGDNWTQKWFDAIERRCRASGGVWSYPELTTELRPVGHVAL